MDKDIRQYLPYYVGQTAIHPALKNPQVITGRWMQAMIEKRISVKPILRKLRNITGEELTECVFLNFGNSNRDITASQISKVVIHPDQIKRITKWGGAIPYIAYSPNGNPNYMGTIDAKQLNADQFHYLLSRGFDLFGLIDAGLAINKKTLK